MNVTPILDYWVDVFTAQLKENTDDELKMRLIKKSPFQDDPIRQAPYLLISEDPEKGIVPEELGEVGGSVWWIANFKVRAAPKSQKTADRAYYLVNLLGQRVIYLLRKYSFGQPVGQGVLMMENRDWYVVKKVTHKILGGEQEWQSYVDIEFFQRLSERGPYPYGEYPGDID